MAVQMSQYNRVVWKAIQPYLPQGTVLKSVVRSDQEQLDLIVMFANRYGYKFKENPSLENADSWQGALKLVRSKGTKIAPPGRSNHAKGIAYDLSGADLAKIEEGVRKAVEAGIIGLWKGSHSALLPELKNNCVHIEVEWVCTVTSEGFLSVQFR